MGRGELTDGRIKATRQLSAAQEMKHGLNGRKTQQKCACQEGGLLEVLGHQQHRRPSDQLDQKSKGNLKRQHEDW